MCSCSSTTPRGMAGCGCTACSTTPRGSTPARGSGGSRDAEKELDTVVTSTGTTACQRSPPHLGRGSAFAEHAATGPIKDSPGPAHPSVARHACMCLTRERSSVRSTCVRWRQRGVKSKIVQQPVARLPWGHVRCLLDKLTDPDARLGMPRTRSSTAGRARCSNTI